MFISERAKVEREHCAKWDRAFQEGIARKEARPRFLVHAWGWVEFRRLARQRQWRYLIDSPHEGAGEPPADKQLALIL